jgi:hypothetical protein
MPRDLVMPPHRLHFNKFNKRNWPRLSFVRNSADWWSRHMMIYIVAVAEGDVLNIVLNDANA